jgi:predicted Zn-dependent protease
MDWIATNGGSHLETVHSNHSFSVSNNGTASFRTTFTSPSNSPIGYLLNRSGDFTLRVRLRDDRGTTIEDTIVVQPWLGYNLNIIRVGPLQSGDRTGLRNMANHASSIWQQINLTMNRLENNWRVTGDVSAWDSVTSDEADDLFQYASVPNDGLDLFIVRDYTGGTGASFEPGDCSKGGSRDGIVMDRRYDGSGNLYWRGMGQTFAHESGHYFGLSHTPNDAASDFRVMHPNFREDRTVFLWSEYYQAFDHCFIYLIY